MSTLSEIFDNMPNQFNADKAGDMDATIQFDLGDDDAQYYVTIANGEISVEKGLFDSPKATISMTEEDFVAMETGQLNPMMAFMSGKVKVDGDLGSVMKFQSAVGL